MKPQPDPGTEREIVTYQGDDGHNEALVNLVRDALAARRVAMRCEQAGFAVQAAFHIGCEKANWRAVAAIASLRATEAGTREILSCSRSSGPKPRTPRGTGSR